MFCHKNVCLMIILTVSVGMRGVKEYNRLDTRVNQGFDQSKLISNGLAFLCNSLQTYLGNWLSGIYQNL